MNYYFDKKDTRQLDISEDLLKYVQFSINNELRSREGSQIEDHINTLIIKAKEIDIKSLKKNAGFHAGVFLYLRARTKLA
jgi:hypothetical protein